MKKTALFSSVLFFTPLLALAQTLIPIRNLIAALNGVIIALVPLLIGAAVVAFFWGLLVYIFKSGKEGNKEGKKIMFAGIVALFIMVSLWGIIALLQSALGVPSNVIPTVPILPHG